VGTVVSEVLNLDETVLPPGVERARDLPDMVKQGVVPGCLDLAGLKIDTALLHNTHSFVIVARGQRRTS
jgi:hypothetical protein